VKLAQAERASEIRHLAALLAGRDRLWTESLPWLSALRHQVDTRSGFAAAAAAPGGESRGLPARLLALLDQELEHAEAVSASVANLGRALIADRRRFDSLADRLLEEVKKALMLPFANILAGFPKMVHDLAYEAGKDIQFHLLGAEMEIDKRILEQIKDPLVHLVRNSIDHGIETPAERVRSRKTPRGAITLSIAQSGGKVEIQIADDGAGLDVAALKAAAVRAGVLPADAAAALPDSAARQLVFRSGLTTRPEVTAVSGRGLGMAIVREHVLKLGGAISLESVPGLGTAVRITLPLTLATLRGTVVRVAHHEFVIPTANISRLERFPRASVRRVENRDSICLDGTTFALVRLAEVLGLPACPLTSGAGSPDLIALLLRHGQANLACTVDQVLGEQEVLAKPLGQLLPRVRNLSGATVLGSGRIVPILSVPDLCLAASGCTQSAVPVLAPVRPKRLLVADDSISIRNLLRSVLESAGYEVQTAPDGAAAFNALQSAPFDLLVSDVEMPRMDGFALAKRIRSEPKLAGLPVVLVTGREAKEDRERGLDAGANAYLVKSGFDQTSLLETVRRLL
jgi:two-component system chemotaxis sensor kinase CheA